MLDALHFGLGAIAGKGVVLAPQFRIVRVEDVPQRPEARMLRAGPRRRGGIIGEIEAELVLPLRRRMRGYCSFRMLAVCRTLGSDFGFE